MRLIRLSMDQKPTIMVVDDEADIRQLLAVALRAAGYSVATAEDARQALHLLQGSPCELVITDLRMPGMSGLDLLRRIAELHPLTKGIVLTGYGSIQSAVEATKLGADNYITKPIVIEEFLRAVRNTVERGQPLKAAPSPSLEIPTLAALTRALAQPSVDLEQMGQQSVDVLASTLAAHVALTVVDSETGAELVRVQKGTSPESLSPASQELRLVTAPLGPGHAAAMGAPTRSVSEPQHGCSGTLRTWRLPPSSAFSAQEAQLIHLAANQIGIALNRVLAGRSLAQTLSGLREASLQTVRALVRAVEMRDRYTAGHSARVSRYTVALARSLGLDEAEIENLRVAALLHDVGKIGISDLLLNKAGRLTPEERARIEEHPVMGCRIVEGVQALAPCIPLIMHHQERYDGLGYPSRLVGEQTPYGARIMAVVDSFEAITADRAYRKGRPIAEALKILRAGAGRQWDPDLVARWAQIVGRVLVQSDLAKERPDGVSSTGEGFGAKCAPY